ncbi:unnamed protein product [Cyclocybe aegerita]|uniref:B30.2/SPRY domain-containing protein n=1 Tax=Cyclocybe aegerita TaxID=1973307 RepID=A0A8S0VSC0_CYCAE|nr:unnamed protein product [Cyclocybe aegerita]
MAAESPPPSSSYRWQPSRQPSRDQPDVLLVLLPLLIVLSTFLFLLLTFLICALIIRRRRGIILRDNDGPVDMSREELIEGDGGFENVESRWLEEVDDNVRRAYMRAKEYQLQYPPNSLPTDITLSQFLSIQEKGVSAWSFEPDYETVNSLLVHARTEITFLPDPASSSCVQSNLPLPKLNEVYYWEVKMFDLPETTNVAVGLATKPYPPFRLPGLNRYSVAYHSTGDKSHNYPFTSAPFGPLLKEGDVLGVGYRPRTGTVFFTRNGRKTEDAFIGLSRWNLFPTIGADGPCSVHVNLGQAGFVFIEANVKKWGLAPSVGTLAPPPAYGSERGSILLDVGGRIRANPDAASSGSSSPGSPHRHRSRRTRQGPAAISSPLRTSILASDQHPPETPPPPITPIDEEHGREEEEDSASDDPSAPLLNSAARNRGASRSPSPPTTSSRAHDAVPRQELTAITPGRRRSDSASSDTSASTTPTATPTVTDRLLPPSPLTRRDPPAYSPLDAFTYADGVRIDLPAEVIAAALEGGSVPPSAVGQSNTSRSSDRRRSRRR